MTKSGNEMGADRRLNCYVSRSQRPRSFWSALKIAIGLTRFSQHAQDAQSICFVFLADQIWREVRKSRTSDISPSRPFQILLQKALKLLKKYAKKLLKIENVVQGCKVARIVKPLETRLFLTQREYIDVWCARAKVKE